MIFIASCQLLMMCKIIKYFDMNRKKIIILYKLMDCLWRLYPQNCTK